MILGYLVAQGQDVGRAGIEHIPGVSVGRSDRIFRWVDLGGSYAYFLGVLKLGYPNAWFIVMENPHGPKWMMMTFGVPRDDETETSIFLGIFFLAGG